LTIGALQRQTGCVDFGTFIQQDLLLAKPGEGFAKLTLTVEDVLHALLDRDCTHETTALPASSIPGVAAKDATVNFLAVKGTVGAGRKLRVAFGPRDIVAITIASLAFEVIVCVKAGDKLIPRIQRLDSRAGETTAATVAVPRGTSCEAEEENVAGFITVETCVVDIAALFKGRFSAGFIAVLTGKVTRFIETGIKVLEVGCALRRAVPEAILLTENITVRAVARTPIHFPTFEANWRHAIECFALGLRRVALRARASTAYAAESVGTTDLLAANIWEGKDLANEIVRQAGLKGRAAVCNSHLVPTKPSAGVITT